jgi:MAP3K TRAFs-binding domain
MELKEPPDPDRLRLVPVVRYSVERCIAGGKADYWDWATLLEIEVLGRNQEGAETALGEALACIRESFEPETTTRNLRLIREARERRGDAVDWAQTLEDELIKRMSPEN